MGGTLGEMLLGLGGCILRFLHEKTGPFRGRFAELPLEAGWPAHAALFRIFFVIRIVVGIVVGIVVEVCVVDGSELPFPLIGGEGAQNHDDCFAHELWFLLGIGHRGKILFDALHQLHSELFVSHFTPAKLELNADFAAAIQEFFAVPHLGLVVVLIDVHAELDLLELCSGVLPVFFLLGEFVLELAEVDDAADRWVRLRCHLD